MSTNQNTTKRRVRTDVHAPKNLVTEDYEYVGCGYYGTAGEPGFSPLNTEYGRELLKAGWHFGENESAGGCYHCGAHIRYYAVLKHVPSHTLINVGETCLENRFERATSEFQAMRKQAQLDREQQRVKGRRLAWAELHPAEFAFLNDDANHADEFYFSLYRSLVNNGELSDRQLDALVRSIARKAEWEAKRAAERATEPDPAPVVEGKITVTGKVLSVKSHENVYGVRLVMTVLDDRGFKVWGTCPSAIASVERGDRVTFSATVERSDRDETFGFFKRPTKATILDTP